MRAGLFWLPPDDVQQLRHVLNAQHWPTTSFFATDLWNQSSVLEALLLAPFTFSSPSTHQKTVLSCLVCFSFVCCEMLAVLLICSLRNAQSSECAMHMRFFSECHFYCRCSLESLKGLPAFFTGRALVWCGLWEEG